MNHRRFHHRSTAVSGYFRYLKPGALAQLRDRKFNAKTQISYSRALPLSPCRSINGGGYSQQQEGSGTNAVSDGELPLRLARCYGPWCPQRKKLMAVRYVSYSEPVIDASSPVID